MIDHPPLGLEPVVDGGPVAGWAPVIDDQSFEALLRPGAVLRRLATGCVWAEGPVWLPADGSVLWSDIPNDRVLRWWPDGRVEVFLHPAEYQNGHVLDLDGSVIACSHGHRRVERLAPDGSVTPIVDRYQGARLNSPNDVVVRSDGTIWFSDPIYGIVSDWEGHQADPEVDHRYVYRYDPRTGELRAMTDALDQPNGLAFSPDESVLYVSDTSEERRAKHGGGPITRFEVIEGRALGEPELFHVVTDGASDGFRVDVAGNVWTSTHAGIEVIDPDGRRLGRLPVPEMVANCVFGGPDGDRLFITATTSLYAIDVAIRGVTA
ncbi:MAG: SMP-30/gluconolactonase/LRE family protein [Chloroflexota bacterium]